MAEVTYYSNTLWSEEPPPDRYWDDRLSLIDGELGTFASTSSSGDWEQTATNTCPGTDLGTITKVELRVYGYGDGDDRIDLTPIFGYDSGDEHETTPAAAPAWGSYVDITNDTNAPDWSLWSHIQDIDCIVKFTAVAKGNTMYCAKVEIRVTYDIPPDIDVGAEPINRASYHTSDFTYIGKDNPANVSGLLKIIKVWANANMTGLRVGTFYLTNATTLKCRDSATIGAVEAGAERTFTEDDEANPLAIVVQTGDYIGCYFASGNIERDTSGFAGIWRSLRGEYIDPGDETIYTLDAGDALSLIGYGDEVATVPPTVTVQAVTEAGRTTAEGHGTMTATGGENASKRGFCWNTTGNPTVADSKVEGTDSFGTGSFALWMTGLTPGEHYYVKAYAYNSAGYGYSDQVEFDTWEPPVSDIDVGADPIDRSTDFPGSFTIADKNNPANASGTLHTVQVYAKTNITALRVGTFYTTDGNTLKCRDSELVGDVVAGAWRTFTELSIAVVAGDYVGCYFASGAEDIEAGEVEFDGVWYVSGEYIDPNDETEYIFYAGSAISLYGYGDIAAPPGLENKSANMAAKMVAAGLI